MADGGGGAEIKDPRRCPPPAVHGELLTLKPGVCRCRHGRAAAGSWEGRRRPSEEGTAVRAPGGSPPQGPRGP